MKRVIIITGILAWAGGMATMLAAPSCDVECIPNEDTPSVILNVSPAYGTRWDPKAHPVDVTFQIHSPRDPKMSYEDDRRPMETLREPVTVQHAQCVNDECTTWTLGADRPGRYEITATVCGQEFKGWADVVTGEDGCHAETSFTDLEIDATSCEGVPLQPPDPGPMCDAVPRPSVHVYVARQVQDMLIGVDVDRVWFEHDGRKGEASCVDADGGICDTWLAGRELEGEIELHTEYCDKEFTQTVTVERGEDGCHVDTVYAWLAVDTLNCLTSDGTPTPPPPPPNEAHPR